MSKRNPNRLAEPHTCQECGRTYYPWPGSRRKYCSNACAGVAKHRAAGERARKHSESITPERRDEIVREGRAALREYDAVLAERVKREAS
ncbi:hypothetical protein [Demequina maris]|uniref:hypothetical protein n=1 Tax=Demequina maris TaxID=1638982 RepID=UPI000780EA3D|nr:hypothetical protein [Demequina maris]